jgi:hypothetical protein
MAATNERNSLKCSSCCRVVALTFPLCQELIDELIDPIIDPTIPEISPVDMMEISINK